MVSAHEDKERMIEALWTAFDLVAGNLGETLTLLPIELGIDERIAWSSEEQRLLIYCLGLMYEMWPGELEQVANPGDDEVQLIKIWDSVDLLCRRGSQDELVFQFRSE